MRGLAFPVDAASNRETSHEYGTPMSAGDDIPIDPALTGEATAIDPVLVAEEQSMREASFQPQNVPQEPLYPPPVQVHTPMAQDDEERQYSQAPQGDPFAPQMIVPYIHIEPEPASPPPVKTKRKRKVKREEECGFCNGNDQFNVRTEQPEQMTHCIECGRSGHPTCMQLAHIGDVIRSYPWRCIECKICEVCSRKGDDEKMMFCDSCDRGWHMYCLNPPMDETPPGKWSCPQCSPLFPEQGIPMFVDGVLPGPYHIPSPHIPALPIPIPREASVASTSQSARQEAPEVPVEVAKPRRGRPPTGRRRGRPRKHPLPEPPATPKAQEPAPEMEVDEEEPIAVPKPTRAGKATGKRGRGAAPPPPVESSEEEPEPQSSPVRRDRRKRPRDPSPAPSLPRVRLRLPTQNHSPSKGKGKEREEEDDDEDSVYGMFDDILSPEDRDTSKTMISRHDKILFERSRSIAEEKLHPQTAPPASAEPEQHDFFGAGPSRPLRSAALHHLTTALPSASTPTAVSTSPVPSTPGGPLPPQLSANPHMLRIRTIRFGEWDIKTWYDAPFPEEYATIPDGRLWICEFCLKYMKSRFGAVRHRVKCKARNPPGDEIYRDGPISIFEVDGRRNKIYCQNLCLLSKMFLDHKSLFYDVEPFLFYVVTEVDDIGARFVGYFSKEKRSPKDYNLSCIMTLPVRQRQGWGNLLIDFSYLLSKKEGRLGSPEKPLSALGQIGYRRYWTLAVMRYLEHAPDQIRLEDIAKATSMTLEDICQTLIEQNMIFIREPTPPIIRPSPGQAIKLPKGRKSGVGRRQLQRMQTQDRYGDNGGPFVPPKHYEIHFDRERVAAFMRAYEAKGQLKLKPEKLQWTPYLLSRKNKEPPQGLVTETPAMATSLNGLSPTTPRRKKITVSSPNKEEEDGEEKPERPQLNLFGSPPPDEAEEEEELPKPKVEVKARRRASKKTPAKPKERDRSPAPELVISPTSSRRLRNRTNGASPETATVKTPHISDALRRGRPRGTGRPKDVEVSLPVHKEDYSPSVRNLRSSRSKNNMAGGFDEKVTPLPSRKRRRVESPSDEEEAEVTQALGNTTPSSSGTATKVEMADDQAPSINGTCINGRHEEPSKGAPSEAQSGDVEGDDCDKVQPSSAEADNPPDSVEAIDGPVTFGMDEDGVKSDNPPSPPPAVEDGRGYINGIEKLEARPLHAESDLRSTLDVGLAEEEYGDEDADGEYEEEGDEEYQSYAWR